MVAAVRRAGSAPVGKGERTLKNSRSEPMRPLKTGPFRKVLRTLRRLPWQKYEDPITMKKRLKAEKEKEKAKEEAQAQRYKKLVSKIKSPWQKLKGPMKQEPEEQIQQIQRSDKADRWQCCKKLGSKFKLGWKKVFGKKILSKSSADETTPVIDPTTSSVPHPDIAKQLAEVKVVSQRARATHDELKQLDDPLNDANEKMAANPGSLQTRKGRKALRSLSKNVRGTQSTAKTLLEDYLNSDWQANQSSVSSESQNLINEESNVREAATRSDADQQNQSMNVTTEQEQFLTPRSQSVNSSSNDNAESTPSHPARFLSSNDAADLPPISSKRLHHF